MREVIFWGEIRQGSNQRLTGSPADNDGKYPIIQNPVNTLSDTNDAHTKNVVVSSIQLSEDGGLIPKAAGDRASSSTEFQ